MIPDSRRSPRPGTGGSSSSCGGEHDLVGIGCAALGGFPKPTSAGRNTAAPRVSGPPITSSEPPSDASRPASSLSPPKGRRRCNRRPGRPLCTSSSLGWAPLWEPVSTAPTFLGVWPVSECRAAPAGEVELDTDSRLHRLLSPQVNALPGRPAELWQKGDFEAKNQAQGVARSCVLNLAIWRRLGTAEFAETLGFVERTDYAAMSALNGYAIDAAVAVWKSGRHAIGTRSAFQICGRAEETRAWKLGGGADELNEAERWSTLAVGSEARCMVGEIAEARAARITPAGEKVVRAAYDRLLNGQHHPFWNLCCKLEMVTDAALGTGGFPGLRGALNQVRGYSGPDPDSEWAGWELALDLKTMTVLADDPGPVDWCSDYVAWLRKRLCERHRGQAAGVAFRGGSIPLVGAPCSKLAASSKCPAGRRPLEPCGRRRPIDTARQA